jgi:hypothetical protein
MKPGEPGSKRYRKRVRKFRRDIVRRRAGAMVQARRMRESRSIAGALGSV